MNVTAFKMVSHTLATLLDKVHFNACMVMAILC
jgi:hypothetical protein